MATITITGLTAGGGSYSASYNSASITETANGIVFVAVQYPAAGPFSVPTKSGLTFSTVGSLDFTASSGTRHVALYAARAGASPSAGAIAIPATSSAHTRWSIFEATGDVASGDLSSVLGTAVTGQRAGSSPSVALTLTLAALASADSKVVGAFGNYNYSASTPGSGFTEIHDGNQNNAGLQTEYSTNDTTVDATAVSNYTAHAGIAVEIKAGGGASTITATASLSAAVQAARSATATITTAVQVGRTATSTIDAAVQEGKAVSASAEAAVSAAQSATAMLSTAVQAAVSAGASVDAAVLAAVSASATISAYIIDPGTTVVSASLSAAIQAARAATSSLEAAIQDSHAATATIDAAVAEAKAATTSVDAAVQAPVSAQASLTAAVSAAITATAEVSAAVRAAQSATATVDAYISAAATVAATVDAAIQATLSASATLSAYVVTEATDSEKIALILKILANRQELDPATGTFRLYDDDGTTLLYEVAAWEDAAGTIPYRGRGLQKLDRLE